MPTNLRRLKILLITLLPFLVIYLLYFFTLTFLIYPKISIFSSRALIKQAYNKHYIPNEVDYLILGDSSGLYSIAPKQLSDQSYSASTLAATLYSSYKSLENLGNIKINKAILLTQTFIPDHYDEDVWKILVPSGEFALKDIFEQLCNYENQKCSAIKKIELITRYVLSKTHLNTYSFSEFTSFIRKPSLNQVSSKKNYFQVSIKSNNGHYSTPNDVKTEPEDLLNSWEKNFKAPIKAIPRSEIIYLDKIIKLADTKKTNLIFVTTPIYNFPHKKIETTSYKNSLKDVFLNLTSAKIRFINGWQLESTLHPEDFIDINHLKEKGAIKFTNQLNDLLKYNNQPD